MTPCIIIKRVRDRRWFWRELIGAVSDVIDWFEKLGEAFVREWGRG